MWTPITRKHHTRCAARYQTDLTDGEWQFLEPLVPAPLAAGRPRKWAMREIINAIFYVLRGGIAWRLLPLGFSALADGLWLVRGLSRRLRV